MLNCLEEWRTINDFPNYEISSFGNIKNKNTNRILKQNIKSGYCNINLVNTNLTKCFKVHRLVAYAFINNAENKLEVNHKDKNKLNNNVTNLEWMTRTENNIHRCKGVKIKCNKNKKIIRKDRITNDTLEIYNSIELAGIWAFNNGYTKKSHNGRNAISNCLNGLSKKAYNFIWEFENKYQDLEGEEWREVSMQAEEKLIWNETRCVCLEQKLASMANITRI
jgi:hypothetical protein